jgi:hypothetical protein
VNGKLEAFNDYLSWPEDEEYELELLDAVSCAHNLGHAAQAARLQEHFGACHQSDLPISNLVWRWRRLVMAIPSLRFSKRSSPTITTSGLCFGEWGPPNHRPP